MLIFIKYPCSFRIAVIDIIRFRSIECVRLPKPEIHFINQRMYKDSIDSANKIIIERNKNILHRCINFHQPVQCLLNLSNPSMSIFYKCFSCLYYFNVSTYSNVFFLVYIALRRTKYITLFLLFPSYFQDLNSTIQTNLSTTKVCVLYLY